MSGRFYRALIHLSRVLGISAVAFFAWWIATGYFLFWRRARRESLRFYTALFPEKGRAFKLCLVWRQFHSFASLFSERLRLTRGRPFETESEGFERIERALEEGQGGVLLMSHLGNWEMAAHLFRQIGAQLMLFMGARQGEKVESVQKAGLVEEGVHVVVVDPERQDSFSTLKGLRFVQSGGMLSFAGDRLWRADQRAVEVQFLGHRVRLPAGPHLFALATGAPLFVFFAVRLGRDRYRLVAYGPRKIESRSRANRTEAAQRSAQEYAHMLEDVVRRYPTQWHHFEPFLGEPWL